MKIALLGDIHGNYRALEAVLSAASDAGADKLLITGDLIGYYFSPLKVMELLKPWEKFIVRGNHEDMLEKSRVDSEFLSQVVTRYGAGLSIAMKELSVQQLDYLCQLPAHIEVVINDCKIFLCHGSPWDGDFYVYPDASISLLERCVVDNFNIVVMGHTHYPMKKEINGTLIINPGSVGQPRNCLPGANWALFDTMNGDLKFFNESYDYWALVKECREINPELPYLSDVLVRK